MFYKDGLGYLVVLVCFWSYDGVTNLLHSLYQLVEIVFAGFVCIGASLVCLLTVVFSKDAILA